MISCILIVLYFLLTYMIHFTFDIQNLSLRQRRVTYCNYVMYVNLFKFGMRTHTHTDISLTFRIYLSDSIVLFCTLVLLLLTAE